MQQPTNRSTTTPPSSDLFRLGGMSAILGAAIMLAGAALNQASGASLDAALAAGAMAAYLADAAGEPLVVANLVLWIVGVFLLGAGGLGLAAAPDNDARPAHLARVAFFTAVPLAIASFVAWLAVVVQSGPAPSAAAVAVADVVGWFASRADWTATVLVVGFGPLLVSLAGRGAWVSRWLMGLGALAGLAGVGTIVAMFTDALTGYGFAVVPIGLAWMIAAGVVALRR